MGEVVAKEIFRDNLIVNYCGDARRMSELPDGSVQMVCCSPPYWGLREYSGLPDLIWGGDEKCKHRWGELAENPLNRKNPNRGPSSIVGRPTRAANELIRKDRPGGNFCSLCGAWKGSYGLEPTPEMYIEHTLVFLREIRRVLRKDGVVFWNIGDSYASGKGTCFNPGGGKESLEGHALLKEQGAYPLDRGNKSTLEASNLKPKDLCLIPFRVAIAAQEQGWWVRSDIIWSKKNHMPESVTDRPTGSHEYILMLTQSGKSLYWTHRDGGGTRVRPKADYRWVRVTPTVRGLKTKGEQELGRQKEQLHGREIESYHLAIIEEVAVEPADWEERITCPDCGGTCVVSVHLGLDVWQDVKCPNCPDKGKYKGKVQLWQRINLWKGHDYYWDAEAVREAYTEPLNRWGGDTLKRDTKKTAAFKDDVLHLSPSSAFRVGNPIRPDPSGRNIRSVWEFPTQPYPEAHFAVFPEKLPETCIKAATPEVGCCSKCGAPWERVIERQNLSTYEEIKRGTGYDYHDSIKLTEPRGVALSGGQKSVGHTLTPDGKIPWYNKPDNKTVGWQPTCICNADKVPSLVLDPFAGSGTTLWVAKKLGRRAVGYELSEEYCKLILERNRQMAMELNV